MKYLKMLERFPKIFDESNYHIDSELDYDIMYISKVGFIPYILSYTRRHKESGTSTIVHKLGTLHQHYVLVLSKYLDIHPEIAGLYKKARLDYAFFYGKSFIFRQNKILEWHKKYYKGGFTLKEYFIAFLTRNPITVMALKVLKKLGFKLQPQ
jgi:hypothetical protein